MKPKKFLEEITAFLNEGWHGEDGEIQVQSASTEPEIQAKDLEEIQDLLGTFQTYYGSDGSGRAQNIETGAELIGGSIVMPGEEFSANALR